MRDPYQILGVSPLASDDDIKKAYREKAKALHPDRHPGNERIAEQFKEISAAYQEINSKNRAKTDFDRRRKNASQQPPEPNQTSAQDRADGMAGKNFHKFYEQATSRPGPDSTDDFFKEEDGPFQRSKKSRTFEDNPADTIFGGDTGSWFDNSGEDTDRSAKSGKPRKSFADFLSGFGIGKSSPNRPALGDKKSRNGADIQYNLNVAFMDAIRGTTTRVELPNDRRVDITIPPGVRDGQIIRLRGQGEVAKSGGTAGDALVEISVEDHPHFMRDGLDIFLDLPITLDEALLGAAITVPTIDGPVTMKIPPSSDSGQTLRLRAKGVARQIKNKREIRGDQYVTLIVKMPPNPSSLLKQAVEEEARNAPYGVRQGLKDLL